MFSTRCGSGSSPLSAGSLHPVQHFVLRCDHFILWYWWWQHVANRKQIFSVIYALGTNLKPPAGLFRFERANTVNILNFTSSPCQDPAWRFVRVCYSFNQRLTPSIDSSPPRPRPVPLRSNLRRWSTRWFRIFAATTLYGGWPVTDSLENDLFD